MKILRILLVLTLLSAPLATAAEWISLLPDRPEGAAPEIILISSDANLTRIEIVLPGFYAENTPDGWDLTVPGWTHTKDVGLPAVPMTAFLAALPELGNIQIETESWEIRTFEEYTLRNAMTPETDGQAPLPAPAPKAWQGSYPETGAQQSTSGYISQLPVIAVHAYPFHVDSETGLLSVSTRMEVKVHHGTNTNLWSPVSLSASLMRRCANSVINFSSVPRTNSSRGGVQYLVIVPESLKPAIEPLAEWRAKTGFNTEIRTVSNPTQQVVKNIILQYGDVEYVLLVGDTGQIPLATWSYYQGDHWYACTTGGGNPDAYADLSIGRLSGTSAGKITPQVNKILDYEQSPPLTNWLKKTLLVAHREQYPQKYTQCKNEIASNMASWSDWNVIKYYGGENGKTNAGVSSYINSGIHIVNYRGHGDTQEWWSWNLTGESYTNSDVQALTNGDMRPIVFNIACNCGDIGSYCMSEAWLDTAGGAVASLGAVHPSYTIPNHDYDKKLYEAIFYQDITDIGGAMDFATDYILKNHGSIGESNAKMYLWLGDPAMEVWLVIPSALTASYDTSIQAGSQSFEVTVEDQGNPLADAMVTCYHDGMVLGKGETGADGKVSLYISPTSGAHPMFVTVCHDEYLPHEGSVTVSEGTLHEDVAYISARDGGQVNFTLKAGAGNANRDYILLGCVSGTQPGTMLPGGLVMPLNFDSFTNIVFSLINTPVFMNFMGTLNGAGESTAQLNSGSIDPSAVGLIMDYAYALNGPWNFASNPVAVTIVP